MKLNRMPTPLWLYGGYRPEERIAWVAGAAGAIGRDLAQRLDELATAGLRAAVGAVVSRIDLTQLVADNVDIDRLVATVDLDAAVSRVDLLGFADYIIDGVDLPSIVRSSSMSMSSEAVHGLRVRGVEADQALSRIVDHLIPHRHPTNGDSGAMPAPTKPAPTKPAPESPGATGGGS